MSETTLIQRLRDYANEPWKYALRPIALEAADALEQQAARIEALRADAERWRYFLSTRPLNTHEAVCAAIDAGIDAALRQEKPPCP